jgi:peptidoglycan/xylan/chitin deacetylase (PgdA/CDA1 family)
MTTSPSTTETHAAERFGLKQRAFDLSERLGVQRVLRAASHNRLRVLLFHSVVPDGEQMPNSVSASSFRKQMQWLKSVANPVRLTQSGQWTQWRADALNVHVTFDDGFLNTIEFALPVLREFDIPATFFVLSDALAGRRPDFLARYHGRVSHPKWLELMTPKDARALLDHGMAVQSHSTAHDDFRRLSPAQAVADAVDSQQRLEDQLGARINAFAFPWGYFTRQQLAPLLAHFERVFSTEHGLNRVNDRVCLRNEVDGLAHLKASASGLVDLRSLTASRFAGHAAQTESATG